MANEILQGDNNRKYVTKRGALEILRGQLINERNSFISHWKELGENILPRRPRFTITDNNKGDKRNTKIIDSTPVLAARTMQAGMMGGLTSPARPWFKLTTPDPDLAEIMEVKDWLDIVTVRMSTIFLHSNLYNILPIVYGDIGTFATSAMMIEEDSESVVRFYAFPIGSYAIANDDRLKVRVFYREFRMTVRQVIDKFGKKDAKGNIDWSNFSGNVKTQWENAQTEAWVEVAHVVMPNDEYNGNGISAKYKKYKSCYYERSATQNSTTYVNTNEDNKLLRESGYDMFPVLCPRWQMNAEDVYGTSCPGMDCLGDIKALQLMQKRMAQAIEKMVNPPMTGPTSLRSSKPTILPGDVTYLDVREGQQGFRPSHEVNPQVDKLQVAIAALQDRIRRAFFEDLFLMLSQSDRREITAREVDERHEEKLLALGPVLEQLNQDLLDPLIDITFDIMLRQGLIPEPPQQLQGMALRVEYVSVMAQAQKLLGIGSLERFAAFITTMRQDNPDPSVIDKVDFDEFIEKYGDQVSIPSHIIRSDDDVEAIRKGRAQQAKAQQAQQLLQSGASTAKDLSQADTSGQNALTDLLKHASAGQVAPQ